MQGRRRTVSAIAGSFSGEQFGEDGVRDSQVSRGDAQALVLPLDEEGLRPKCVDLATNRGEAGARAIGARRGVVAFDAGEVDTLELAEAEKKFLLECLLGGDALDLLTRRASLLDCSDVSRGIVN